MVTKLEAIELVQKLLVKANKVDQTDLQIDEKHVSDLQSHWIIPFQSQQYMETQDSQYAILGITPFAVSKETGQIDHEFPTSQLPDNIL